MHQLIKQHMKSILIITLLTISGFSAKAIDPYYIIVPKHYVPDSTILKVYYQLIEDNSIDSCENDCVLFSYSASYHIEKDKSYFGVIITEQFKNDPILIERSVLQCRKARQLKYMYPLENIIEQDVLLNNSIEFYIIYEEDWNNENMDLLPTHKCCLSYTRIIE